MVEDRTHRQTALVVVVVAVLFQQEVAGTMAYLSGLPQVSNTSECWGRGV